jgi:hypothetical protein
MHVGQSSNLLIPQLAVVVAAKPGAQRDEHAGRRFPELQNLRFVGLIFVAESCNLFPNETVALDVVPEGE